MSLKFKIIEKCWQDAKGVSCGDVDFFLEKDGWDDFGFHVMYHIHASSRITHRQNEYLGAIRIMKKGQKETEQFVLEKDLHGKFFEELPKNYVSLSSSVDVYESLSKLLNYKGRKDFVKQLHLIFDEQSPFYDKSLEEDECFSNALLRDCSFNSYSLLRGKELMDDVATIYNLQKQEVDIKFFNSKEPVALKFSCLSDSRGEQIPNGVVAFIGKNGSGKSTAIYNLAKLIYANPDQRFRLKESIGLLEPNDLGISKLFVVSYSPFDNFVLPGIGGEDYRLLLKGLNEGDGRFVFCGIRDIKEEFEEILQNPNSDTYEKLFEKIRLEKTKLKPIDSLAEEFAVAMSILEHDEKKVNLWEEIADKASILFSEISEVMKNSNVLSCQKDRVNMFKALSTGYKFFLHSLSSIIASINNDCMILFDEPENHIHPPMLSFMMYSLRMVLKKYQSVMLVATHSPVVLQEIFSNNVFVVRRNGDETEISHPRIETYGASVSEITAEVFDLTTDVTNYYEAYESLYKEWNFTEHWENLDDMVESFKSHLDGKISSQLLAYLIGIYMDGHPDEFNEE